MMNRRIQFLTAWLGVVIFCYGIDPTLSRARLEPSDGEIILKEGEFSPNGKITVPIIIPREYAGVTVRLTIASPFYLDLDLFLYDSEKQDRRICRSTELGGEDVCSVKRPAKGKVWAVVQPFDGNRPTAYRLTASFLSERALGLRLAGELPRGDRVLLPGEKQRFRLVLDVGEVAVVALEGKDREFSVYDEQEKKQPGGRTPSGTRYFALGEPLVPSNPVISGLKEPRSFLIEVAETEEGAKLFGSEPSWLSVVVVGGEDTLFGPFLIPFSPEDVEPSRLEIRGRILFIPGSKTEPSGKLNSEKKLIVYRVGINEEKRRNQVAWIDSTGLLSVALCNQFGYALDASNNEVKLDTRTARFAEQAAAFSQTAGGDDLYVVVLLSPDDPDQRGGSFTLNISKQARPPQMK